MLRVDASGWLEGIRRVASPNADERPEGTSVELVVVHAISLPPGQFGGRWIEALFTNTIDPEAHPYFRDLAALRVSAHVLVRRDGELVQFVSFDRRAWHAGESCYDGRTACNDFSVGIELEGCDEEAFEPVQYERLGELIAALRERYRSLRADALVGHCDIAPGRKTDPGPHFDRQRLNAVLARLSPDAAEANLG